MGITPRGLFSFISNLFTGSISDKKIVEQSGFLDKVEYGDDIMADRGFLNRWELALKGQHWTFPHLLWANKCVVQQLQKLGE